MKSFEKLQQLQHSRRLNDKEVYSAIGMAQQTYSHKKLGIHKFWPNEKRAIEKLFGVDEGYLDDDALPLPVINHTKVELSSIVIDMQGKYINHGNSITDHDQRIAKLEALLARMGKRRK